jgi:hypothetical protein
MANGSRDFQDRQTDQPATPSHALQDQAPLQQQESPADSARRAIGAPNRLAPQQALALQKAVGNRAVQRHLNSTKRETALQDAQMAQDATFKKDLSGASLFLGMAARALAEGSEVTGGGTEGPTEAG